MKKYFIMCLIICMIFSVTACGGTGNDNAVILENPASASGAGTTGSSGENEDSQGEEQNVQNGENDSESFVDVVDGGSGQESNILIAYFSRVGNTEWEDGVDAVTSASLNVENGAFVGNAEYLAKMAAEVTGGDLFLIQTEETYPSDYRETTNVASAEQSDNARPALASHVGNMDQYDTVVLIYPNWWGTLPMPLYTFLEEYDFSGKTILPLCTHEGSRMGSSVGAIAELCPDAILLDGLAVRGSDASSARSDVETWIRNSGILVSDASSDTDTTAPVVYMTTDISPEGLMAVYDALEWTPEGKVAVKLSTGEPPASNYLRPELIADVVAEVDGTIVECNTAYGGSRAETAMHYQVAEDHGFTAIADFQILDENGSMSLPVTGGTHLAEDFVGAAFADYDSYLILSHFKGHAMAGFGGAIKNISIGLGSSEGKSWIHTGGTSTRGISGDQDAFLESMGEAGTAVVDALDGKIVYVNVMNRLSVDCDCSGNPAEPDMHDIGILASADPVALDQACIDLVYAAEDNKSLVNRIESRNGLHTLEYAEQIGLGSRTYTLVSVDE